MPEEDLVEVIFRIYDGSNIGPFWYSPSSTVGYLKEKIVAEWPRDNKVTPKTVNDVKIISSGRILENSRTVGQCQTAFVGLENGAITMHVVIQPSIAKTKSEKKIDDAEKKNFCSCSIL